MVTDAPSLERLRGSAVDPGAPADVDRGRPEPPAG
jgi:hypothetical protein